ncbi:MAG: hypothetical protein KGL39_24900 [Patescibacteria group bacterium]|nr:hypothetical protein [Patescibacteria group bacterium]
MTPLHYVVSVIVATLFLGGLAFVLWAFFRKPVQNTVTVAEKAVTTLEPYVAPIMQYVHPARAFDDWIENEAKNAAAIMKAKLLADYHAAQNLAAHQAALAPKPIPLPAPTPDPPPTPAPATVPNDPSQPAASPSP